MSDELVKWHEAQADYAMNSLSCGSNNHEYRQAHKEADFHRSAAARIRLLEQQLKTAREEAEHQRQNKDGAYLERNRLVALLATMFPSGLKKTTIPGWNEAWHNCVYIDFPEGQASWHFHDTHAWLFEGLPQYEGQWDGHTTDEKYERIRAAAIRSLGEKE